MTEWRSTEMLTAKQTAIRLGLSLRKVYELAADDALTSYRVSPRRISFAESDVDAYLASCRYVTARPSVVAVSRPHVASVSLAASGSGLDACFRRLGIERKPKRLRGKRKDDST